MTHVESSIMHHLTHSDFSVIFSSISTDFEPKKILRDNRAQHAKGMAWPAFTSHAWGQLSG